MRPFWDRANAALEEFWVKQLGYVRIVAHGIEYRSIHETTHGTVEWVSHYSRLTDPDATVTFVKGE